MFVITIDTEWVPQELLDETVKLLDDYSIQSTLFITNNYDFTNMSEHELSIHPNFYQDGEISEILKKTISLLPANHSLGSRSHGLFSSTKMFVEYEKLGIKYDSNYFIPFATNPEPFIFDGIDVVEIPIFFADDNKLQSQDFKFNSIHLNDSGTKVFLFHPSHIFMNTTSLEHYKQIKNHYHDYEQLSKIRKLNEVGIRNMFTSLLEYIEKNNISTCTMAEVNNNFRSKLKS
jgi:hypothetical protein